jgi:hypothetical protein
MSGARPAKKPIIPAIIRCCFFENDCEIVDPTIP